jgi:hypothetical protein
MDQEDIIRYIIETFTGIELLRPIDGHGAGDTFIYYAPDKLDPSRQMPFATIVTKDYEEFDNFSQLNRPGIYRLNIGISRDTFRSLFGHLPNEEDASGTTYNYAASNTLMPHPIYAKQAYVCILNLDQDTFESIKPLLAEAYALVASRHARTQTQKD